DTGLVVSLAAAETKHERIPTWVTGDERALAEDDVLVYATDSWQAVLVGGRDGGTEDVIAGRAPEHSRWIEVPVERRDGSVITKVAACLIGQPAAGDRHPAAFTLAGELWERSGHGDLIRLVDASLCQIALYEEDREGWYGAAASDLEELWQRQHGERSQPSFLFEVLDRGQPLVVEDAAAHPLVGPTYADAFGVRSLLALPLVVDGQPIGAAVLAQRDRLRTFTDEEVQLCQGLAHQAAVAIKNARLHALAEEERHLQKDFVLVGFGQWGQKAYAHLQTLKQFFNFRIHVVERGGTEARQRLVSKVREVEANGDVLYWDSPESPAHEQLAREMESSSYVITYIVTPAATHLGNLGLYYDLSNVVLIEKPLGA